MGCIHDGSGGQNRQGIVGISLYGEGTSLKDFKQENDIILLLKESLWTPNGKRQEARKGAENS